MKRIALYQTDRQIFIFSILTKQGDMLSVGQNYASDTFMFQGHGARHSFLDDVQAKQMDLASGDMGLGFYRAHRDIRWSSYAQTDWNVTLCVYPKRADELRRSAIFSREDNVRKVLRPKPSGELVADIFRSARFKGVANEAEREDFSVVFRNPEALR